MTANNNENTIVLSRAENFGLYICSLTGFLGVLVYIKGKTTSLALTEIWSWVFSIFVSILVSVAFYHTGRYIWKFILQKEYNKTNGKPKNKNKSFLIWISLILIFIIVLIYIFSNFKNVYQNKPFENQPIIEDSTHIEIEPVIDSIPKIEEGKKTKIQVETKTEPTSSQVNISAESSKTKTNPKAQYIHKLNLEFSDYHFAQVGIFDTIQNQFIECYYKTSNGNIPTLKYLSTGGKLNRKKYVGTPVFKIKTSGKIQHIDLDVQIEIETINGYYFSKNNNTKKIELWVEYNTIKITQ